MNKTAKKAAIVGGIVIGGIAALFLLLYLAVAIIGCFLYGQARSVREYVCLIPETGSGFAPQGIAYSKEKDLYIQTGYGDGDISHLYIVRGNEFRRVKLAGSDGSELKGHAGGVACVKNRVYVAGDSTVILFDLDELIGAGANTAVNPKGIFFVDSNAAFCFSDGENLYVGEFYRKENYKTDPSHCVTTPSGDTNNAIVSCYPLDSTGLVAPLGTQPYPLYCISVPSLVQGFAIDGETVILSRSYGLTNSALDYHLLDKKNGGEMTVKFKKNEAAESVKVPLYYLDSASLYYSLTLPSFSEDIDVVNGRVIVTNEASANKYVVGKFFGSNKVYSYPIERKKGE